MSVSIEDATSAAAPRATRGNGSAGANAAENDSVLPSYFPLKVKKCAIVADAFFTCFELNHKPGENHGREALLTCAEQMKLYKECMQKEYVETKLSKSGSRAKSSWWSYFGF